MTTTATPAQICERLSSELRRASEIAYSIAQMLRLANPDAAVSFKLHRITIHKGQANVTLDVTRWPNNTKAWVMTLQAVPPFIGQPDYLARLRQTYKTHGYPNPSDQWHRLCFELADADLFANLAEALALHGVALPAPETESVTRNGLSLADEAPLALHTA